MFTKPYISRSSYVMILDHPCISRYTNQHFIFVIIPVCTAPSPQPAGLMCIRGLQVYHSPFSDLWNRLSISCDATVLLSLSKLRG